MNTDFFHFIKIKFKIESALIFHEVLDKVVIQSIVECSIC